VVRFVVACLGLMPLGCTVYQPRPVTFTLRDAETKQPIEGADVAAHYTAFMDFGVLFGSVGPMSGKTDRDGRLTLIVDPDKPLFSVKVDAEGYPEMPWLRGGMYTIRYLPRSWFQWSQECEIAMYRGPQPKAELLLPAGYRGPVVVYFPTVDVPPSRIGQREFSFPVSDRGGVEIPHSGMFQNADGYDCLQARFPDGASLKTIKDLPGPSAVIAEDRADSVAFRLVTVDWNKHAWIFVVGTAAEAEALNRQVWPDDNHEDKKAFDRILADHPRPEAASPPR
jgi:hypothetical protein